MEEESVKSGVYIFKVGASFHGQQISCQGI